MIHGTCTFYWNSFIDETCDNCEFLGQIFESSLIRETTVTEILYFIFLQIVKSSTKWYPISWTRCTLDFVLWFVILNNSSRLLTISVTVQYSCKQRMQLNKNDARKSDEIDGFAHDFSFRLTGTLKLTKLDLGQALTQI